MFWKGSFICFVFFSTSAIYVWPVKKSLRGIVADMPTLPHRPQLQWHKFCNACGFPGSYLLGFLLCIDQQFAGSVLISFPCCLFVSPKGGIQVTENGCAIEPTENIHGTPGATADAAVNDTGRIAYFQGYLEEMHNAIQLGADVRAVSCLHPDLERLMYFYSFVFL